MVVRKGKPRTDEERKKRHKKRFGNKEIPKQRKRRNQNR